MKRILSILILLIITTNMAHAQKYTVKASGNNKTKIEGVSLSNNRITLKTDINGHKVRIKSPVLSKNKYLKLINIS